jgi:hypothetical protein
VPNRKGYGKVGKRKAAFQLSHSHDYYEIPSVMGYGFKGQVHQAPDGIVLCRRLSEKLLNGIEEHGDVLIVLLDLAGQVPVGRE